MIERECKNGHKWVDTYSHIKSGRGCPYCSGKRVCKDNCLATINPQIANELNEELSGFTANEVVANSNKLAWWECSKGHKWEARVADRHASKRNCPYCSNQKACRDNCLATKNPELAKEWHPTKNSKTPNDVLPNSKYKVWWLCPNGHEYEAKIYHRNTTSSCPFCSQGVVLKDGEFCHSVAEAYFYLKLKNENKRFLHNKPYGLGTKRYDFYITDENKYVEVTSFFKSKSRKQNLFYIKYLRNIVEKKRFVENVLGAKFEFMQIKLSCVDRKYVRNSSKQFVIRKRRKTNLLFVLD